MGKKVAASHKAVTLEEFLANATAVLQKTERNLQELAQAALLEYEQSSADQANGHYTVDNEPSRRLQRVSQQLLKLSEQSNALQTYLATGIDGTFPDDEQWPRVRIIQSQEEERAKLAHELEDGVGQLLANAIFELASCRHLMSGGQDVTDGLDALQAELEQGLTDLRYFITNLEPATVLGSFGLSGGIRRYLEQFEARTGLKTQLRINTNLGRLPSIVELAVFRIIQETLSNVYVHAHATQVDVVIEEVEGAIQFSVIDNGDGLVSEKIGVARKNLGLARMVDYAELLDGELRILSEPGRGTQVVLSVSHAAL